MERTVAGISSEAVEAATGHDWDHWLEALDARGAGGMTHPERVAALEDLGVGSAWWRQTIANGFAVETGIREVGETVDAGYQVGVQRTIAVDPETLWELLLAPEGRRCWLGEVEDFDPTPGARYETADGTSVEVRTIRAGERLRLTWRPADRAEPTTLQLALVPSGGEAPKTALRVHHEKLADAEEREVMREHWRRALDDLEALAEP